MSRDPYQVLGVSPDCSQEQLHDAYRRLVKLHHPDRNGDSPESTRRFQEIQAAYDEVRRRRARGTGPEPAPPPRRDEASVEARMADLERELREAQAERERNLREAQAARERTRRAARDAARDAIGRRPPDEELGYYSTDDSFGKILSDVRDEVSERVSGARRHPSVKRVSDLIEGLEGLTSRFERRR